MMQAKRILLLMLLIICGVLLLGCAQKQAAVPIATAEPAVQTTPVPTPVPTPAPKPVYGDMLRDGSYDIEVDSSSSMFRPVKAVLTKGLGEYAGVQQIIVEHAAADQ